MSYNRTGYYRNGPTRRHRDDYNSEEEHAAGIHQDYNSYNSRPHHHHSHDRHHGHDSRGHGHSHRRASARNYSDEESDWGYHRGTRHRDHSAEPRNGGLSALMDGFSEDGDQPKNGAASFFRSSTMPVGPTTTKAPALNGTGSTSAPLSAAQFTAKDVVPVKVAPVVIENKDKGKVVASAGDALQAAPKETGATTTISNPAIAQAAKKWAAAAKKPAADEQAAAPKKAEEEKVKTDKVDQDNAADVATPEKQEAKPVETQTTDVSSQVQAAPTTEAQPQATANPAAAPGLSRYGWERFRTDPRLRAALDSQIHERYGRYPGDAPGYNGYPYGSRHHHYGPHPHHNDRQHQYNPYTGQFDRTSHYPYPPSGHTQDPLAARWASHQFAPPLYPFGRPLFANAPELPNLLNRAGAPYPTLPVPPVEYLRDLAAQKDPEANASGPLTRSAPEVKSFKEAYPLLEQKQTLPFLEALKKQELEPQYSDAVFRIVSNVIQVRFGEREGEKIINRVHVVPRGHFALGTVMADQPRLDIDLVLPSDYMLRRWIISPTDKEACPKTVSEALGLDSVTITRSEVDEKKLAWVLEAVWEQLDGVADGFIFPGGADEAGKYLPASWCNRDGAKKDGNRLRLVTKDGSPIRVNLFVKVAINLNGEMIVGVDQSSAKSAGKYQMVKVLRTPGVPLGETPLSPIDRSAIITLNWWKRSLKAERKAGDFKIRTSHFILALAALHSLPPSHALHVPRAGNTPLPFSIVRVMDVMNKVLQYLKQAYNPPPTMSAAGAAPSNQAVGSAMQYVFPLSACTTMDALYTQAVTTKADSDSLKNSKSMDELRTQIDKYLKTLGDSGFKPGSYTEESA